MSENAKETILVAEDSVPNRKILSHVLAKLGYLVIECEDGDAAKKAIEGGIDNLVLVISDVMMPKMDGLQLLRYVREESQHRAIPFVLATAVSDKEFILQAKNLGVNGYILKPLTFQRVVAKLQELFPKKTFPKTAA